MRVMAWGLKGGTIVSILIDVTCVTAKSTDPL